MVNTLVIMIHMTIGTDGQGGAYPFVDKTGDNTWMKGYSWLEGEPAIPQGANLYINFSYGQDLYDWVSGSVTNNVKKMNAGVWVDEHKGWKTAIYPNAYNSEAVTCAGMLRYHNTSTIIGNDVIRLAEFGDPASYPGQPSDTYSVALDVERFSDSPDDIGSDWTWQFVVKALGEEVARSEKVPAVDNGRFMVMMAKASSAFVFIVKFALDEEDILASMVGEDHHGWKWDSSLQVFPSSFSYPRWTFNGYTTGGSNAGSWVTYTNGDFIVQEFGMFG